MRSHVSGAPKKKTKGAPAKPDHQRHLAQKKLRALRKKARRPCNHHVLEIQEAWFQAEWAYEKLIGKANCGYPGLYVPWYTRNRLQCLYVPEVVYPSPPDLTLDFHMTPIAHPSGPLEDLFVPQLDPEFIARRSFCVMEPPFPAWNATEMPRGQ